MSKIHFKFDEPKFGKQIFSPSPTINSWSSRKDIKNNHYLCSMFDVSAIYNYIAVLKEKPDGDYEAYQEKVKIAEVAFRSALTQVALEKEDGKGQLLFLRDFQDLADTLKESQPKTKSEKLQAEWLAFEAMKAKEAADYIRRVSKDLSSAIPENVPTIIDEKDEEVKVISGTQGLADFLGCGKTKAFEIIKSGILKDAGIQYQVGKCWKFNAQKLKKYLVENPVLLQ